MADFVKLVNLFHCAAFVCDVKSRIGISASKIANFFAQQSVYIYFICIQMHVKKNYAGYDWANRLESCWPANLRELRRFDMTQEEFARRIGVSQGFL